MEEWESRALARMKSRRSELEDEYLNRIMEEALGIFKEEAPVQAPTPDPKPDPDPDPTPTDFKTFHIIDHRNQPDLRQFGLEPLKIYYKRAFFDSEDRDADVNMGKVRAAARAAPKISCPDIERWADKNTWRVSDRNVARYIEVCKQYRGALPAGHKFGLYSILPVRNYFHAVGEKSFLQWQDWNDEVTPIAEHVDVLFPSLYTFSSVFQGQGNATGNWQKYAIANIAEARRIAPGKPVYPFLWPWYHPRADTPLDQGLWRIQLETCKQHADGFVIWDDLTKTKTDWGKLPPWWDETVDFMKSL